MTIRVQWWRDGQLTQGDLSLLDQFQCQREGQIWVDVQGTEIPDALTQAFDLHELSLMDARRLRHPPKVEVFDNYVYILQRGIQHFNEELEFSHVQISFFLGDDFLISFHQNPSYSVDFWWQNKDASTWFAKGLPFLTARILNTLASRYLETLLEFEQLLGDLEDSVYSDTTDNTLNSLNRYRSRLRKLRRIFRYHEKTSKELIDHFKESEGDMIYHWHDVYDKNERLCSLCELYYELTGDLIDGSLSMASHRLNRTMQVLTVITAIFVPLGFLAGLYGMNFEYMPELKIENGYYFLLGSMGLIATALITIFKVKRWL